MSEFLTFRKMLTPIVIQLIFWLGLIACLGAGVWELTRDGGEMLIGIAYIVLGPLAVRIYAELLIVIFRIQSSLNELVRLGRANGSSAGGSATPAFPMQGAGPSGGQASPYGQPAYAGAGGHQPTSQQPTAHQSQGPSQQGSYGQTTQQAPQQAPQQHYQADPPVQG